MRMVITSKAIKCDENGAVKVRCGSCGAYYKLEIRKMTDRDEMRNQPWCSKCRAKSAAASKKN